MIAQMIGPIAELAGGWLKGKADANAANAKLKLTEAEAKAKIMLSKETSIADWERIMAQGSRSSWKDEWFVIVLSIPLILAFIPGAEVGLIVALSSSLKPQTGIFTVWVSQFLRRSVCVELQHSLRGSNE